MADKHILSAFRVQVEACEKLGSPLTAALLRGARDDFAANGPVAHLLRGWAGDPLDENVPLRLAGFFMTRLWPVTGRSWRNFMKLAVAGLRRLMRLLCGRRR